MTKDLYAPRSQCLLTALGLLAAAAIIAGCGKKEEGPVTAASGKFEVADDASSTSATGSATAPSEVSPAAPAGTGTAESASGGPAMPGAPVGDVPTPPITPPIGGAAGGATGYQVPEGKEALITFLQQMDPRQKQPKGQTQQELMDDYRAIHTARIQAADKLLKVSQEKQDRQGATQAKLDAMRALVRLGDRQAEKDLNGYSRTVSQDPDPEIANLGRLMLFGMSLESLGSREVTDVQPLLAELKKLIAEQPGDPGVFVVTARAAEAFMYLRHKDAAADAYQTIGNAYKDSRDAELAKNARVLLDMGKALALEVKLDLDGKLKAMQLGEADSVKPVMEALKSLLAGESPGDYVLDVATQIAQLLERSGQYPEAGEAFAAVERTFKDNPNQELAKQAKTQAENGLRRSALVGQPFTVAGVQADGSPFDWGKYQGKVVLVDFWATWCGPCLEEIPNIDASYKKYKTKGFEVVGVNLDDDSQTVVRFLDVQPLPWTTVLSADPNARGFDHPLAVKCGIDAIPFLVLLDRDGKVNALHVRGEKLEQKLAELLGPADEPAAAPAIPADKPAAEAPKADG